MKPSPVFREHLTEILSLDVGDLDHKLVFEAVSCGLSFLLVPLKDRSAVARAWVNLERWEVLLSRAWASMILVFTRDETIRARMFAPGDGVPEDPVTGSAAAALSGYLANREPVPTGTFSWTMEQGFEMGRSSILELEADKVNGQITAIRVGGQSVLVSEGTLRIPD